MTFDLTQFSCVLMFSRQLCFHAAFPLSYIEIRVSSGSSSICLTNTCLLFPLKEFVTDTPGCFLQQNRNCFCFCPSFIQPLFLSFLFVLFLSDVLMLSFLMFSFCSSGPSCLLVLLFCSSLARMLMSPPALISVN